MTQKRQANYYKDAATGKEPAKDWINSLKDNMGKAKILTRIERAESGNFGDYKSVGDGVFELRISFGPGYRVYYALDGQDLILLLIAGDKSTQQKDIANAKEFWTTHKKET